MSSGFDFRVWTSRVQRITADGDFDGVTATLILLAEVPELREREVEFPAPFDTKKRDNALVIERPERAGVEAVAVDHHDPSAKGYVTINGQRIWETVEPMKSVARVVARLLGVEEKYADVLEIVDVVDSEPKKVEKELFYIGYRAVITDQTWRKKVVEIVKATGDFREAWNWMISTFTAIGKVVAERLEAKVSELVQRAVIDGDVAVIPVFVGKDVVTVEGIRVDLEQMASKPAMMRLEHDKDPVIAMNIDVRKNIVGLSIASPRKNIADKIAKKLVELGLAESGGGRPQIAGAQKVKVTEPTELIKVLKERILPQLQ
ncbi:MAG: hypothetical protein DRJ40_08460 [Thermoprotei archaeon]|nr:MAG: hypothetical protein DRJ40_08460 [Thermoprotei archaeon]